MQNYLLKYKQEIIFAVSLLQLQRLQDSVYKWHGQDLSQTYVSRACIRQHCNVGQLTQLDE